jgi:hypothetical protein
MFRAAGNDITPDLVDACPAETTCVEFVRRGAKFRVYVPGRPGMDAFSAQWRYEVDGLQRLMRITKDIDLYRSVRGRILAQDKNTLSTFARLAVAAHNKLNYTLFGDK